MIFYYLLIWILPRVNDPLWSHRIGPLTGFECLGILSLTYAGFHLTISRTRHLFFLTWQARTLIVLYSVALVSALIKGRGISLSNSALIVYTSATFLFFITLALVDSLARLKWTMFVMVGSYAFTSLYLIREWRVGRHIWANFRPGWIAGDANYFSAAAMCSILLSFYLMQARRPQWERLYYFGCLFITLIAFTLAASRGGFFGLAASSLFVIWHSRRRIRNFAILSAFLLPMLFLLPQSPIHRLLHPEIGAKQSERYHLEAWTAGFQMIKSHPITGIGLGNFKSEMPAYNLPGNTYDSIAHNMFIEIAAELGLPALVLFLAIIGSTYLSMGKIRKQANSLPLVRTAAAALQAGLVGLAASGCFISAEYQKTTWSALAIMACLAPLAKLRAPTAKSGPVVQQNEILTVEKDLPFEIVHE